MIEGFVTAKDIAIRWGVTVRTVQVMCSEGKIVGQQSLEMYGQFLMMQRSLQIIV